MSGRETGVRARLKAWARTPMGIAVGAVATAWLVAGGYAAVRPHLAPSAVGAASSVGDLPPVVRRMLIEEALGPDALREVDLATAPRNLDALGDPTPWLLQSFERCGTVSLAPFEASWRTEDEAWERPVVHDGRVEGGGVLRREVCPVHVVSDAPFTALATFREDVSDPGDAQLAYVRIVPVENGLRVCLSEDLDHFADTRCVTFAR